MSFFLAIIIGLGLWYFIIKPMLTVRSNYRQMRDLFNRAAQQQRQQQETPPQPHKPNKKKIDPTVGEYVEFTETIETHTEKSTEGKSETQSVKVEQQVTDVTWEDLP